MATIAQRFAAAVPLTIACLAPISHACAEVIILGNQASATASIAPGTTYLLPSGTYASDPSNLIDQQASPGGPQPSATASATLSYGGHRVEASASGEATPQRLEARIKAYAKLGTTNNRNTAESLVEVKFQLTTDTSLIWAPPLTGDFWTAGGAYSQTYSFSRVEGGVETAISVPSRESFTLPAGSYVYRAKATTHLSSIDFRGQSGMGDGISMGAGYDFQTVQQPASLARGPAPTAAPGSVASGPFTTASTTFDKADGVGKSTVYYPSATTEGPFALVVVTPGLGETQSTIGWLGARLASWGFVVATVDTVSTFDSVVQRAARVSQLIAATQAKAAATGSVLAGKLDPKRTALVGHGTGQPLDPAYGLPNLAGGVSAAIALAPRLPKGDVSTLATPALIVACQNDWSSPPKTQADALYAKLLASQPRAELVFKAGGLACATSSAPVAQRDAIISPVVGMLKVQLDKDARFNPYWCGASKPIAGVNGVLSYRDTCTAQ